MPIAYGTSGRQINAGNYLESLRFSFFLLFSWRRVIFVPILVAQRADQGAGRKEMRTFCFRYVSPAHYLLLDATVAANEGPDAALALVAPYMSQAEADERAMAAAIGEGYEGYRLEVMWETELRREAPGIVLVDSGANG